MSATCLTCGADYGTVGVVKDSDAGKQRLCGECVRREGVSDEVKSTVVETIKRLRASTKESIDLAVESIERLAAACDRALAFVEQSTPTGVSAGARERRDRLVVELRKVLGR